MNNRNNILSTFLQVADILRETLPYHQVAELPAIFFFIKRLTDSIREKDRQGWLSNYLCLEIELQQFTWRDLISETKPNQALLQLLRKIEKGIDSLSGLSERSSLAYLLLAEQAPEIQLRFIFELLENVPLGAISSNEASEIFQLLLDRMAEQTAGNSVTPVSVRHLLIELSKPNRGYSIYDPVCGYASLLCDFARITQSPEKAVCLFGQDLQRGVALVAKMNTLLGNWSSEIEIGDTLTLPLHLNGRELKRFDIILANPPFGIRIESDLKYDEYKRFIDIQPLFLEVGIIQHICKSLADNGRGVVLISNGFLFRSGSDFKVRKELIETDRIHAIISLPANLFSGTAIATSVLVLNGPKRFDAERGIILVDLTTFAEGQKTRRHLTEKGIKTALECMTACSRNEGISTVVSKKALRDNEYDLSVSRYIQAFPKEQSFQVELKKLTSIIEERNQCEQKALSLLNSINFEFQDGHND